ncbi:MAG: HAD family hydrolase [Treponema sp.]|jgi:putative hydrolase of the HAD superfamily|nr:HAD family hydrolase [Treponema sp.]
MGLKLKALAFDLDGTLYPNYRFNRKLIPFIRRELPLLLAFGHARNRLRGRGGPMEHPLPGEDFYTAQARLMAARLGISGVDGLREKVERLIYRGWEPLFRGIKLYPHVVETLETLRRRGFKLALLSDFPPETKLSLLGLEGIWDLVLCSEVLGALKPDPRPFAALVRGLGLEPAEILYVGNSVSYDIQGAKNAGLRAALISPWGRGCRDADFVFRSYRKLGRYVLG